MRVIYLGKIEIGAQMNHNTGQIEIRVRVGKGEDRRATLIAVEPEELPKWPVGGGYELERRGISAKVRDVVKKFAEDMERKLFANDHKGGWEHEQKEDLLSQLEEEVRELRVSFYHDGPQKIIDETADVGNFAMMIADLARRQL